MKPPGWAILTMAILLAAGCSGKKSEEPVGRASPPPQEQPAQREPAPQATPPSTPAAKPSPKPPTSTPAQATPEVVPQRPKQEPSPSPAAEPPTLVPDAKKPDPAPPKPVSTPMEEARKAVTRDVAVLTGSPMGGVRLEHKLHAQRAGNSCAACHHASKPQKPASAPQQACSDCHTKVAAAPMKTKYQAAFHNPTAQSGTCIDCHKSESAKGKKAPLKCVECHKKENK